MDITPTDVQLGQPTQTGEGQKNGNSEWQIYSTEVGAILITCTEWILAQTYLTGNSVMLHNN